MSPSRPDPPSLAATRNSTLLVPCPEAGDNAEIQFTELVAVHAHSGCAVIENEAAPPLASTIGGAASETWHFTGSGPVGVAVVVEEVLQAPVMQATRRAVTAADLRRSC
jgi:hypothetical protein